MNPEKFNRLVTELTEIRQRSTNTNPQHKLNPKLGLPKIKSTAKPCDECGKRVKGRVVTIQRVEEDDGLAHWRKRCNICKFITISKLEIK
jgi:hypothetical protein